jgi:hypothetical protein
MMEPKPKHQIIAEMDDYIKTNGGIYSEWYCGITHDTDSRLFTEHNVDEQNGIWVRKLAFNVQDARVVEAYFVRECGTDGGPGGGEETSKYVYAYKKTASTNP